MTDGLDSVADPAAGDAAADRAAGPAVRWFAALIAVFYGFAKLNGAQFTILESELDKPLGDVSGFWLTWYYFSYSPVYGNLIALAQVAGGLLLTFPRFALAGALLLLPLAANIVLVDIFYGIDLGGLLAAIAFLVLLVAIIAPHRERLVRAVVSPAAGTGRSRLAWAARVALVLGACGFTYFIAHFNNRHPTAIDGAWATQQHTLAGGIERVFFERNRAYLVVMKDTAGQYSGHHFELEPDGRIRIWEEWLQKGDLLFEGTYAAADSAITLWPAASGADAAVALRRAER